MLLEVLHNHVHSIAASIIGGITAIVIPADGNIEKIITGVITGVLIWGITNFLSYLLNKIGIKHDR